MTHVVSDKLDAFYDRLESYLSSKACQAVGEVSTKFYITSPKISVYLPQGQHKSQFRIELIYRALTHYHRHLDILQVQARPMVVIRGDGSNAVERSRALRNQPEEPKKTVIEVGYRFSHTFLN
jgi:exonuclease III